MRSSLTDKFRDLQFTSQAVGKPDSESYNHEGRVSLPGVDEC